MIILYEVSFVRVAFLQNELLKLDASIKPVLVLDSVKSSRLHMVSVSWTC
jgi:hypothetical protein